MFDGALEGGGGSVWDTGDDGVCCSSVSEVDVVVVSKVVVHDAVGHCASPRVAGGECGDWRGG
jgi:hypothetical protein